MKARPPYPRLLDHVGYVFVLDITDIVFFKERTFSPTDGSLVLVDLILNVGSIIAN